MGRAAGWRRSLEGHEPKIRSEAQRVFEMEKRESSDKEIKGETAGCRHLKENDRSGDAGWSR